MNAEERRLEVRVPASTSNLGPGFDCLGLALDLELHVRVERVADSGGPTFGALTGTAETWPRDATNLVWRAFERAARELGSPARAWRIDAHSAIPVARGLGSSGAAVAAGLLLASALAPRRATDAELLRWGCALEGHPDNSSAALLGGCTLSVPIEPAAPGAHAELVVLQPALSTELGFALAWPRSALPTAVARRALPPSVPFADAVENPRRLALLLEGLRSADPRLLALGGEDRLHVRHRLPLIAGAEEALAAARDAGAWLATISGSGSALIALGPRGKRAEIAEALRAELERAEPGAEATVVEPALGRPAVRAW
jgi:homoserine kinase